MTSSQTVTRRAEDFFHSGELDSNDSEQTHAEEDEDHAREVSSWRNLPRWQRPSPYWLIFGTLFSSTGFAALLAPKVAMYTALVCRVHRPEHVVNNINYPFALTHNLVSLHAADAPIPYAFDTRLIAVGTVSTLFSNSTYNSSFDHTQTEPDYEQECASDPVVQAVVARLNAVFNTSMGILSCLTAGWWGSLSDRYGRRVVLFASTFGLFVTEFAHVVTAWFAGALPGGYWFPLVGFLIEGLCGGMSSGVATNHAYLADTTDPSTRSRYFSLSLGLTFMGVAAGPALGGLLIRSTGTMISVFYFASILHGAYTIFILLILPESLTRARTRGARRRQRQEKTNQESCLDVSKSAARLLSPIIVLLPEKFSDVNQLKQRRDWNLFFIAVAYGLGTSALGSYSYKFQYAAAQFNWTPEITSYYVSLVGATRALFLAAVLPLIIKYSKATPIQLPTTPDEPLRGSTSPSPSRGASSSPGTPQTNAPEQRLPTSRSPTFDLALARASAGLDTAAFLGMAVAGTGTLFALAGIAGSFSAGLSPATQALALDIYTNRRFQNRGEIGKLFGALGVIQSLGSQVIGPALYGIVYFSTVAVFPQAIMIVSICTSLLALTFLFFVRIRLKAAGDCDGPALGNEQGNLENEVAEGQ